MAVTQEHISCMSLGGYKFSSLHPGYTKVHQTIVDLNDATAEPMAKPVLQVEKRYQDKA